MTLVTILTMLFMFFPSFFCPFSHLFSPISLDFEYSSGNYDRTRALYDRLLSRTAHIKVWLSYADMELSLASSSPDAVARARAIYERAEVSMKEQRLKDERVVLHEAWRDFEEKHGDDAARDAIAKRMPRKIKKRRRVESGEEEGGAENWEEYYDYVFPADEAKEAPNLKLLAMAHRWKQQQEMKAMGEQ